MSSARVQPADLARWRAQPDARAEQHTVTRRLIEEVELLLHERARARREFARQAAQALAKRIQDVAAFNSGGCPTCHEAEARAFLEDRVRRLRPRGLASSTATWAERGEACLAPLRDRY